MGETLWQEYMNWSEKQDGFTGWPDMLAKFGRQGILEDFETWLQGEKHIDLY